MLQPSANLYDPPARYARKIEFIGDSDTAGYGLLGPGDSDSEDLCEDWTKLWVEYND